MAKLVSLLFYYKLSSFGVTEKKKENKVDGDENAQFVNHDIGFWLVPSREMFVYIIISPMI